MKTYLVTATDSAGRRDTFGREAASVEHLRAMLELQGYTNIEFVDDEISATLRTQRPDGGRPRSRHELQLEAKLRKGPATAALWLAAIRSNAVLLTVLAATAAYGLWTRSPWWFGTGAVLLVGWALLVRAGLRAGAAYDRLLRACAEGDWPAAEELIERISRSSAAKGNAQLQEDLVFRRAALLARSGHLEQALALVEPLRDSPHGANGMFENRVASVYYVADRQAEFLECMRRSYEQSGNSQPMQLDLAFALARVGDIAEAGALLRGIERRNLSDLHQAVALLADGICARRSGAAQEACDQLARACEGLSAYAKNPAVWPVLGIAYANRALALAALGRKADARTELAEWRAVADASLDGDARRLVQTHVFG
ncbi:MAG TPA: hypothetical protein VEY50_08825 [Lysobacter sp.]|nr:hypothetical protein [Lysobacter sp.]